MSTSLDLDSIQITPRTPRTARDMGARMNASLDEEVEMSLLDERERAVDERPEPAHARDDGEVPRRADVVEELRRVDADVPDCEDAHVGGDGVCCREGLDAAEYGVEHPALGGPHQ